MISKHSNQTSFIDLLFCLVMSFIVLFMLSMLAQLKKSEGNVIEKAEFVIQLEWPDKSNDDIDLWIKGPDNSIVYYSNKSNTYINLDRDDYGRTNDMTILGGGRLVTVTYNRELASIRGIVPGRYVVNVVCYTKRDKTPTLSKITLTKLNPYIPGADKEIMMTIQNQETTAFTFNVTEDGHVTDVNFDEKINLIEHAYEGKGP